MFINIFKNATFLSFGLLGEKGRGLIIQILRFSSFELFDNGIISVKLVFTLFGLTIMVLIIQLNFTCLKLCILNCYLTLRWL